MQLPGPVQIPGPTESAGGEDAASTEGARGWSGIEDVEGGGPSEAIDDFYEGMGIEDSRGRMVRQMVPVVAHLGTTLVAMTDARHTCTYKQPRSQQ